MTAAIPHCFFQHADSIDERTAGASSVLEPLNRAAAFAAAGRVAASLDTLRHGLNHARAAVSPDAWRALVGSHVHRHPIFALAHENPFVHRCYAKPRVYAGDAVMLDFIYCHAANRHLVAAATPRGRDLMEVSLTTPAPRAVRNRCRLLADEIDAACLRNPSAEILAVACGHLRETEHSAAIAARSLSHFVALDQDPASLAIAPAIVDSRKPSAQFH